MMYTDTLINYIHREIDFTYFTKLYAIGFIMTCIKI